MEVEKREVRDKSSKKRQESNFPKNLKAGEIVEGQDNDVIQDKHDLILGAGGKGVLAGRYIAGNGVSNRKCTGGSTFLAAGMSGDDLKTVTDAFEKVSGNLIQLKIRGPALSQPFERKFKPTDRIDDVIMALKKMEKHWFDIMRDTEILDGDLTIAQLQTDGSTVDLMADLKV